ncbi:MAG: hypothetical protein ACRBCJ_04315 [Hyphomicrobiaceae bacterium]
MEITKKYLGRVHKTIGLQKALDKSWRGSFGGVSTRGIGEVNSTRYHREGLKRFVRVIDGNENYAKVLKSRLHKHHYRLFGEHSNLMDCKNHAIHLARVALKKHKFRPFLPKYERVACFGGTENNLREFRFLNDLCNDLELDLLNNNYVNCPRTTGVDDPELIQMLEFEICQFYAQRKRIDAAIVHQQNLFTASYIDFVHSFSAANGVRPKLLVLANDHSPSHVAMSMAAKSFGIPRVYLQHAEVSSSFPALDFEATVLRNSRSKEIYKEISELVGEVFIIPRSKTSFSKEKLTRSMSDEVSVVVYPTNVILFDELKTIIDELRKNPRVNRIALKLHPQAPTAEAEKCFELGVEQLKTIPKEQHVAIVANSSVVIELLHRGIPVYQNFSFDPVMDDYYGFVNAGLATIAHQGEFSENFWGNYKVSSKWLTEFSKWDPTAEKESSFDDECFKTWIQAKICDRTKMLDKSSPVSVQKESGPNEVQVVTLPDRTYSRVTGRELAKKVARRSIEIHPRLFYRTALFILRNLSQSVEQQSVEQQAAGQVVVPDGVDIDHVLNSLVEADDPSSWLAQAQLSQLFTEEQLVFVLKRCFDNRLPLTNSILYDVENLKYGSLVYVWARMRAAHWVDREIPTSELKEAINLIHEKMASIGPSRRLLNVVKNEIIDTVIACNDLKACQYFLERANLNELQSLTLRHKFRVVQLLEQCQCDNSQANYYKEIFFTGLSSYENFRLKSFNILSLQALDSCCTHGEAEREFLNLAPRGIAAEYREYVQPTYDRLRARMTLMDVRTIPGIREAFREIVEKAISDKRGFSMVRLCDREGYVFSQCNGFFNTQDVANCERHWWGEELDQEKRREILHEVKSSVQQADIVGLPSIYRFARDNSPTSSAISNSLQGRGLLDVCSIGVEQIASDAIITDCNVNDVLYKDAEYIAKLGSCVETVHLISSVKRGSLVPALQDLQSLRIIEIPGHFKSVHNENFVNHDRPIPYMYKSVCEEIVCYVRPGDLVLVSGGLVGKIFLSQVKSVGGIALDIGHAIDFWTNSGSKVIR